MNKKLQKILKYFFFPFILIVFWLCASLLFNNKVSFSVLEYRGDKMEIKEENNLISGEFKAKEDNLGLVMLRFNAYVKNSTDTLTFRIKEKGKNWHNFNDYRAGLITNNELFPFGFPKISDSKDKTYQFELFSKSNKVTIDRFGFSTGYEFSKKEIFSSKEMLLAFLIKKTSSSLTDLEYLTNSIKYLIPLLIYIFILIFSRFQKRVKNAKYPLLFFLFPILAIDILMLDDFNVGIFSSVVLMWCLILLKTKITSKVNFQVSLALIVFWVVIIILRINSFQDKLNIWTYTFLVIGGIQAVLEEKYGKKKV